MVSGIENNLQQRPVNADFSTAKGSKDPGEQEGAQAAASAGQNGGDVVLSISQQGKSFAVNPVNQTAETDMKQDLVNSGGQAQQEAAFNNSINLTV